MKLETEFKIGGINDPDDFISHLTGIFPDAVK